MLKKRWSKKLQATLAAGIIATSITPVLAQAAGTSEFQEINMQKIMADIALLAANDNARVAGFEGEHDASNYLVSEFQNLGIKTRKLAPDLTQNGIVNNEDMYFVVQNFGIVNPYTDKNITPEGTKQELQQILDEIKYEAPDTNPWD